MLPFVGGWIRSQIQPHVIYVRRQGITLAVAAVFGIASLMFVVLTIFLALTYLMAPLTASLLCAGLTAITAGIAVMVAFRRAKIRNVGGTTVIETPDESTDEERTEVALRALKGVALVTAPAVLLATAAWLISRRSRD